jgi:hypothetical protein
MRRRNFISLVGCAVAWPVVTRAAAYAGDRLLDFLCPHHAPTFSKIGYALNSARSALASFKSMVSKPSVNHP